MLHLKFCATNRRENIFLILLFNLTSRVKYLLFNNFVKLRELEYNTKKYYKQFNFVHIFLYILKQHLR